MPPYRSVDVAVLIVDQPWCWWRIVLCYVAGSLLGLWGRHDDWVQRCLSWSDGNALDLLTSWLWLAGWLSSLDLLCFLGVVVDHHMLSHNGAELMGVLVVMVDPQ